ncbi:MAG TPA: type II toxin-antitoxin system VapC family toxin [Chitinophagales bacterium]|jgi:predicted nucleic acid-binding protein|nr:type II toxin-antitoxin system VapC family toxin [Bacteroidia bacterium]HND96838.1 type II toxin-antitoxin system VapC family toxin [Chitinophagaceae bacterium]HNN27371.1 type II toxin-antitoxin system VapC family toxin [Chitinophagales bacterium]
MEQYLIDSNVVSDYLSASLSAAGIDFLDSVIDAGPNLSVISQIELLCWNTDKATTEKVKNFIADSVILDISPDVVAHCVALRKGKKIKTPDAIIAASALANGFVLITNNEKDFANIKGLKIVNPHKL